MRSLSNSLGRYSRISGLGRQDEGGGNDGNDGGGGGNGGNGGGNGGNRAGDRGQEARDNAMNARGAAAQKAEGRDSNGNKVDAGEARLAQRESWVQAANVSAERIVRDAEAAKEAAKKAASTAAGASVGTTVGGMIMGPVGAKAGQWIGGTIQKNIAGENAFQDSLDKAGVSLEKGPRSSNVDRADRSNDGGTIPTESATQARVDAVLRANQIQTVIENPVTSAVQPAPVAEKKDIGLPLIAAGVIAAKILLF